MGSITQGVQELENIGCPHPHKSELGDGTQGAGPLSYFAYQQLASFIPDMQKWLFYISITAG